MKKTLVLIATSLLLTQAAHAQWRGDRDQGRGERGRQEHRGHIEERDEYERGPMRREDTERLRGPGRHEDRTTRGRGDDFARDLIGGIIGAIADQAFERDHARRGYRGQVVCYAQNRRGEMFRASAPRARMAQMRAMNKCEDSSRWGRCRPMGCQSRGW